LFRNVQNQKKEGRKTGNREQGKPTEKREDPGKSKKAKRGPGKGAEKNTGSAQNPREIPGIMVKEKYRKNLKWKVKKKTRGSKRQKPEKGPHKGGGKEKKGSAKRRGGKKYGVHLGRERSKHRTDKTGGKRPTPSPQGIRMTKFRSAKGENPGSAIKRKGIKRTFRKYALKRWKTKMGHISKRVNSLLLQVGRVCA